MTAAPAKNQTIKLQTNIPLIGVVKYMDYWPAKVRDGVQMGAQVSLKGTWDEKGEGTVYLPSAVGSEILAEGLAHQDGEKAFQGEMVPQFRWDYLGKIRVLRSEDGRKKHTTVGPLLERAEKNGSPPIQQAEAVGHATTTTHTAGGNAEDESDDSKAVRKRWADLSDTYDACVKLAVKAWKEYGPFPMEELVRSADCLFIEANKRNLPPPPKREVQA